MPDFKNEIDLYFIWKIIPHLLLDQFGQNQTIF